MAFPGNRRSGALSQWLLALVWIAALSVATATATEASSLSGTVRDTAGAPVQGVQVRAVRSSVIKTVLTNASGKFNFPDLDQADYVVSAFKKFYQQSDAKTVRLRDKMAMVDFSIRAVNDPPISELPTSDIVPFLPGPANERSEVIDLCARCHGLDTALAVPHDAEGWDKVIGQMRHIAFGEMITDKRKPAIIDYLSKNFSPDSTLSKEIGLKAKQHSQIIPMGSDVEFTEVVIPKRPWEYSSTGLPSEPVMAASDGKGTVWFTEAAWRGPKAVSTIGKAVLATGKVTLFDLKTPNVSPYFVGIAPDGRVWFTAHGVYAGVEGGGAGINKSPKEIGFDVLVAVDPTTDAVEEIPAMKTADGRAGDATTMTVGKNGLIWYCSRAMGSIVSYDPETKKFKQYSIEGGSDWPFGIAEHGDKIWFGLVRDNKIGYLVPATGEVKLYSIPSPNVEIERIKVDEKGRVWLPEQGADKLGVLLPGASQVSEVDLPYQCQPYSLEVDKQGIVWTDCIHRNSIVGINPDTKAMTEYPQPRGSGGIARELNADPQGTIWYAEWFGHKVAGFRKINND